MTGTPGVGKTTFARELAGRRNAELIELAQLISGRDLSYARDRVRGTTIVNIRTLQQTVKHMITQSAVEVVVEGHLSHLLFRRREADVVFVLRCDPGILTRRLMRKGWRRRKVEENLLAEVLDICLAESVERFGLRKIAELDTSWWRPNRMVNYAMRILDGEESPQLAGTDWLGTLAEAGVLKKRLEGWSSDAGR